MRKLTDIEIERAAEEYIKNFGNLKTSGIIDIIKAAYLQGMIECQKLQEQPLTNPPK